MYILLQEVYKVFVFLKIIIYFRFTNLLYCTGWPKIYIQIYHLDWLGRSHLFGYGYVTIPTTPGAHILDCFTWRPFGSLRERFVQFFLGGGPQLKYPDLVFSANDRYKLNTESMGMVSFEINLIFRNFEKFGVEYKQ